MHVEAVLEHVVAHLGVVEDGQVLRLEAGLERLVVFVVGHDRDAVGLLLDQRLHVEALLQHGDAVRRRPRSTRPILFIQA